MRKAGESVDARACSLVAFRVGAVRPQLESVILDREITCVVTALERLGPD